MSTVPNKNKKSVTVAELGCHGRCEKPHRRSKWSNLGEFLQSVHEEFPSNIINKSGKPYSILWILPSPPFSCLGIQPRWEKGLSRLTYMRMLKRPHCRPSTTWQNHTWHKNWIGVPFPDSISHSRIYPNNKGFKLLYGFSTFFFEMLQMENNTEK